MSWNQKRKSFVRGRQNETAAEWEKRLRFTDDGGPTVPKILFAFGVCGCIDLNRRRFRFYVRRDLGTPT